MNTDKVLALARQSADIIQDYAMEVTEYEFTDDSIQEFAALLQREMGAENAELRRDAERYRWLRKHRAIYDGDLRCEVSKARGPCEPDWVEVSGNNLDKAIDRARSANERI